MDGWLVRQMGARIAGWPSESRGMGGEFGGWRRPDGVADWASSRNQVDRVSPLACKNMLSAKLD